jgi:hypothetical protein
LCAAETTSLSARLNAAASDDVVGGGDVDD